MPDEKDLLEELLSKSATPNSPTPPIRLIARRISAIFRWLRSHLSSFTRKAWNRSSPVRAYIKRRRMTLLILAACVLGTAASIAYMRKLYLPDRPQTLIEISPPNDSGNITSFDATIEYFSDGDDKVSLIVRTTNSNFEYKSLNLLISKNLKVKSIGFGILGYEQWGGTEKEDAYNIRLDPSINNYQIELGGNIFGSNPQELFLDLGLSTSNPNINAIQYDVFLTGLNDVDILQLEPQPTQRNSFLIAYTFQPNPNADPWRVLNLRGSDDNGTLRLQYFIFAIGVVIGVLTSSVVEITLDLVKDFEDGQT